MKVNVIVAVVMLILLAMNSVSFGDVNLSYENTVDLITATMRGYPSEDRQERYRYIRFDKCRLDYNVTGIFPTGDPYDIAFSGIDFSSLNPQQSKTGSYYRGIVMLNFRNDIGYRNYDQNLTVHTVVVSLADEEKAQLLHKAFLHLGALCGAGQNQP